MLAITVRPIFPLPPPSRKGFSAICTPDFNNIGATRLCCGCMARHCSSYLCELCACMHASTDSQPAATMQHRLCVCAVLCQKCLVYMGLIAARYPALVPVTATLPVIPPSLGLGLRFNMVDCHILEGQHALNVLPATAHASLRSCSSTGASGYGSSGALPGVQYDIRGP